MDNTNSTVSPSWTYVVGVTKADKTGAVVVFTMPDDYINNAEQARVYFSKVVDPKAEVHYCMAFEAYDAKGREKKNE